MLPSPSACKAEEEKERDDNPAAKLAQAPNNSFLNELRGHFPFNFLLFSVYFLVQLLAELVEVSGSGGHYPLITVAGDSQFRRKQVELWVGFAQNLYIQEPTPSTISRRTFPGTSWLTRVAIASMIMAKICDSRV